MTPFTLAIIYDTSFIIRHDLFLPSKDLLPAFTFRHYVGRQVKQELKKHLGDPDMKQSAVVGRGFLVRLMQQPGYQEVDFDVEAESQFQFLEPLIGPDSNVDRQLLTFAAQESRRSVLVYIATRDGGIEAELVAQHNVSRMTNVYSPSMEDKFKALVFDRYGSDGSLNAYCPACGGLNVLPYSNLRTTIHCLHCKTAF